MTSPSKGTLLIANPFLKDPNFSRSVVFLCDHQEEGAFGFVLSRSFDFKLDELVPKFKDFPLPVFTGGPVKPDTLHFLHQYPNLIPGGEEVMEGTYWGGNFESLSSHLLNHDLASNKIRFFIGYSGWSDGQLDEEMKIDSWLTLKATPELLFETTSQNIWKESLRHLGGDFEKLINYPLDPQLN